MKYIKKNKRKIPPVKQCGQGNGPVKMFLISGGRERELGED